MADNPLFYKNIVSLNRERHKRLKVDLGSVRYGFARTAHIIPAVVDEFFAGGRSFPIVFIPGPVRATPVFLVGFEPGENLFVGADGEWTGDYIPAFIRRYPFIIGEVEGGQPLVCFDDASPSISEEKGEALFLESGEDAPHLRDIVKFTSDYMAAANRTGDFVDLLQKLGLFTSVTIAVRRGGTAQKTLHGAMSLDVAKFDALSDETFIDLRKKGFLQAIYSQVSSMALVEKLAERQLKAQQAQPDIAPAPSSAMDEFEDMRPEKADLLN